MTDESWIGNPENHCDFQLSRRQLECRRNNCSLLPSWQRKGKPWSREFWKELKQAEKELEVQSRLWLIKRRALLRRLSRLGVQTTWQPRGYPLQLMRTAPIGVCEHCLERHCPLRLTRRVRLPLPRTRPRWRRGTLVPLKEVFPTACNSCDTELKSPRWKANALRRVLDPAALVS